MNHCCWALVLSLLCVSSNGWLADSSFFVAATSCTGRIVPKSVRGGGNDDDYSNPSTAAANDNAEIDAVIEELVASVDTSDEENESKVDTEPLLKADRHNTTTRSSSKKRTKRQRLAKPSRSNVQKKTKMKPKHNATRQSNSTKTSAVQTSHPTNDPKTTPSDVSRPPPPPPNALFRFLLRTGPLGHVVIMFLILLSEWTRLYLPPLAGLCQWMLAVVTATHPDDEDDILFQRRPTSSIHQISTTSARTGRKGRERKEMIRKADEAALELLKRVGNVSQAKYRHVSRDFLQRHGLGPFASSTNVTTRKVKKRASLVLVDEEEEDVDWILNALAKKETKQSVKKTAGITPSVSLEVGSGGPSVGVGVEFTFGEYKQPRQSAIAEAVLAGNKRRKQRQRPRVSDREGGDGMLGRIRAAAGSNTVSRSLFGAYPGDAVPIEDAANPKGVLSLAKRYGYGEWSDDEDDEPEDPSDEDVDVVEHDFGQHRSKRRHQLTRKRRDSVGNSEIKLRDQRRRRRRRTRRSSGTTISTVGIELSFGSKTSPTTSALCNTHPVPIGSGGTRRMKLQRALSPDLFGSSERSATAERHEPKLVSLKTLQGQNLASSDDRKISVRPAMERLNKVNRAHNERAKEGDAR